jgi:hypothetical protein
MELLTWGAEGAMVAGLLIVGGLVWAGCRRHRKGEAVLRSRMGWAVLLALVLPWAVAEVIARELGRAYRNLTIRRAMRDFWRKYREYWSVMVLDK